MVTLTTDIGVQSFNFQPREGEVTSVLIVDDNTRLEAEITGYVITQQEWFSNFSSTFSLIENREYYLRMYSEDSLVYQTKILCTNQDTLIYSNESDFKQLDSDNEFIIIE